MTSRRLEKIAQAILETVSTTILLHLRDPRIRNVTVLHVDVAPDVQSAKIYISIMGDEKEKALCMHGLQSAKGFLQSKIADRIQTKYTPVIKFVLDTAVKDSLDTIRILDELQVEREAEELAENSSSEEVRGTDEENPQE
ncbi:30S ribosome-binding factor RbfA [Gimesia maris]|jgi:ribosome-binding factor A|uniref:Ribosome-binding factor A n=1 Tax=Gimesia maris TaxID=122 RepID=A0A3D3R9J1_9PLAN|nr:30S ribosome-binding factor RbfA [Gimesia maris]MAC53101.1 ribosome-binding factor A [Gimesia sp.]HAW27862.1 30S ribosome-binding factor RbfA [Planctomycetaceae bacterium]EDL56708.1 probable ribosome-binding factor A [Gimesia maris DSM 8797]QDT77808.1 Ribosome-binding factor A [Gimesia maris]QDU13470.1 Ribosome-binding factor A [Gimesia maris]|tara:strand:+ start:985 stop:1404 length:420 start_codon:yes stop_codon:yes gene_type:complete